MTSLPMKTLSLISLLAITACAPRPNSITPENVPPTTYRHMTCSQLADEHARLLADWRDVRRQQHQAANADFLGVIAIGLPVSGPLRLDRREDVASVRGHILALEAAHARRPCHNPLESIDPPRRVQNTDTTNR